MPAVSRKQLKHGVRHQAPLGGDDYLLIREPTIDELKAVDALDDKIDHGPALVALIAMNEDGSQMFATAAEVAAEIPFDRIASIVEFFGKLHNVDTVEKNS